MVYTFVDAVFMKLEEILDLKDLSKKIIEKRYGCEKIW
jgi:hypothetical protein